jgi:hypothetical protein
MAEDVKVPKLGKMNKKVVIPIVVAAGGYLAYRWWQARNAVPTDPAADGGFEDPGVLPSVAGSGGIPAGGGSNTQTSNSSDVTTNAQWSQLALDQLDVGDKWSRNDIAVALGNLLTGQPLTDAQQEIVRAAYAVAGHPPVGDPPIIGGGNTNLTVAPTGVTAGGLSQTGASISFANVAGAATYNVYASGSTAPIGTGAGAPIALAGLQPGTSYTVTVAGVSKAGTPGPKSSPVTFKTPAAVMGTPSKPAVSSIVGQRVTLTTSKVPYATGYRWYIGSDLRNETDGPAATLTNLKPKTKYTVTVQADSATGPAGKMSTGTTFTTK